MNATEAIQKMYTLQEFKEIADHGCQSGVCHEHIYYGDTIKFFDTYEAEIVEYIADTLGGEVNEQLWKDNACNLTGYKNDSTWCFIELVAMQIVDEHEATTLEEEATIASYATL